MDARIIKFPVMRTRRVQELLHSPVNPFPEIPGRYEYDAMSGYHIYSNVRLEEFGAGPVCCIVNMKDFR